MREFEVDYMAMGFHVYQKTWEPNVEDILTARIKSGNTKDTNREKDQNKTSGVVL